jgi:hypothetical protein
MNKDRKVHICIVFLPFVNFIFLGEVEFGAEILCACFLPC